MLNQMSIMSTSPVWTTARFAWCGFSLQKGLSAHIPHAPGTRSSQAHSAGQWSRSRLGTQGSHIGFYQHHYRWVLSSFGCALATHPSHQDRAMPSSRIHLSIFRVKILSWAGAAKGSLYHHLWNKAWIFSTRSWRLCSKYWASFYFTLFYILLSVSNNSFSTASEFIAIGGKGLKNCKQENTEPVTLKVPIAFPLKVHLFISKGKPSAPTSSSLL